MTDFTKIGIFMGFAGLLVGFGASMAQELSYQQVAGYTAVGCVVGLGLFVYILAIGGPW